MLYLTCCKPLLSSHPVYVFPRGLSVTAVVVEIWSSVMLPWRFFSPVLYRRSPPPTFLEVVECFCSISVVSMRRIQTNKFASDLNRKQLLEYLTPNREINGRAEALSIKIRCAPQKETPLSTSPPQMTPPHKGNDRIT
ncbi:unnamed protein product [Laminaria digitata]